MSNPFKKAELTQAKAKIGSYGGPGSGKTFTFLTIATALGKTAVIDTEHGSDLYANRFNFDVLHTRSFKDIIQALDELERSDYQCLILDSITHVWEGLQNAKIEQLRNHPKPEKRREELFFQDWKDIKKPYKELIVRLMNLNMHVFIAGRLEILYEMKSGQSVTKVGETMKAEKDTPYEPHVLIKMEQDRSKSPTQYICYVEKDRSGILAGKAFVNPTLKDFKPLFDFLEAGKQQAKFQTESETATQDEEIFEEGELAVSAILDLAAQQSETGHADLKKYLKLNFAKSTDGAKTLSQAIAKLDKLQRQAVIMAIKSGNL